MLECTDTHNKQDASYKLNVVSEARSGNLRVGRIIIVTLLWSEIMGGYNTPDTVVEIGAEKYVVK